MFCFGRNSFRILSNRGPRTWREGLREVQLEHHHLRCCSRHCNIPGGPWNTTGGEIQPPRGSFVLALHSKRYYSKLPSAHSAIIVSGACHVISTVPSRNAIIIPVIRRMSRAAGSGAAFVLSNLPCSIFPTVDIAGVLGLNLREGRGNGDNGERNWLEGCWCQGQSAVLMECQ